MPHEVPPSIWEDSHQSVGATSRFPQPRPLRKRVQALRTLWDLHWHGESKAVATHSLDPQVSACPICRRHRTQAHVLCDYPSTTGARMEGSLDLNLTVSRLPSGPMLALGRKFQLLLSTFNQPTLMARRWAGQWDHAAIHSHKPDIERCTKKQIKAVLGHIGRVTTAMAAACWREFTAMAKD